MASLPGMISLVFLYRFRYINHRRYPNILFIVLKKMQQLAMCVYVDIDIMSAANAVEKENQQGVRFHRFFNQADHVVGRLAIDAIAINVI